MDTIEAARRGRDGDQEAWRILNDKIRDVVLDRLDARDLPPGFHADDLLQAVAVQIWRSLHAFDPDAEGASFRGWIWTIRHRKLTDLWRKHRGERRHVLHTTSVPGTADADQDPADPRWIRQSGLFRSKELAACVEQARSRLDPKDRDVLRMREAEHLDFAAIATRLGYQKAVSARTRYFRAREARQVAVRPCFAGYEIPR